jgi:hypothetical protein
VGLRRAAPAAIVEHRIARVVEIDRRHHAILIARRLARRRRGPLQ